MARFDVFRFDGGYVLDVQADHLTRFETRVVAPLLPAGWESLRLSFITDRPAEEPGFALERQEGEGRSLRYTTCLKVGADRIWNSLI